eukprot:GHUV01049255.1.p1 GENE.GHUV01049255.1~~GHUV01049255.1.p1  ORF type:complete len:181 (-),score=46.49 GHUV01049255.1:14-556(-)
MLYTALHLQVTQQQYIQQHLQLPRQQQQQRLICSQASASSAYSGPDGWSGDSSSSFLSAFWRFLRPHTIRGTILGTSAVVTKVLLNNLDAIDWGLLPRALMGLVALLCGNGYIVGINQIYDVDIDAVNKPFLPVAAGKCHSKQPGSAAHTHHDGVSQHGIQCKLRPSSTCGPRTGWVLPT